jgi:hypothetical protein
MHIQKHLLRHFFSFRGDLVAGLRPCSRESAGVTIAPFLYNAPSAGCISADFELNWAWRELAPEICDARGRAERLNFPLLMSLSESTRVPVTWATVGHMFLEECRRGANGLAHASMPRPPVNGRWDGDWYKHDPCSSVTAAPHWYSPDLIDQIVASSVKHEIGTHSFSHIDFSAPYADDELVKQELLASAEAMQPFKAKARTLVYPFNRMGHAYLSLLGELGVASVRHRDERIRFSYPERTASGVYKIYESLNLRAARFYDYFAKAASFADEAVRIGSVFHIWFHPSDSVDVFENQYARIVEYMAKLRDQGKMWLATMSELAAYAEARDCIQLKAVPSANGELAFDMVAPTFDRDRYGDIDVTLLVRASRPVRRATTRSRSGETIEVPTQLESAVGEMFVNRVTVPVRPAHLRLVLDGL